MSALCLVDELVGDLIQVVGLVRCRVKDDGVARGVVQCSHESGFLDSVPIANQVLANDWVTQHSGDKSSVDRAGVPTAGTALIRRSEGVVRCIGRVPGNNHQVGQFLVAQTLEEGSGVRQLLLGRQLADLKSGGTKPDIGLRETGRYR